MEGQFIWLPLPSLTATCSTLPLVWRARQQFALSIRQSARGLKPQHSKEIQYDEYDRDDEQYVDKVAGLRETRADVPAEKAEQPQHD
jgi:hypothetical protein